MPKDSDDEQVKAAPSMQYTLGGSTTLGHTRDLPLNRNGWRYTHAGPSSDQLPLTVYRTIPSAPCAVRWDWSDRSTFMKISPDARVVCTDKGWRAARANVPVREGSWYCEIEILPPEDAGGESGGPRLPTSKDGPHVRLGWARREAPLNAPVGCDAYGYGLRDTTGQRVFLSRNSAYGQPFGPGDVVGLYIHVPPLSQPRRGDPRDPRHVRRKRIPIRYKNNLYFEQLDYPHTREMERLMDRSWAGDKLLTPEGSLALRRVRAAGAAPGEPDAFDPDSVLDDGTGGQDDTGGRGAPSSSPPGGVASSSRSAKRKAASKPTAPPGSNSGKANGGGKGGGGGGGEGGAAAGKGSKAQKQLRPLPTLGPDARIGFFVNGEPQGWAFRDLLDFRPLRSLDTPGGPSRSSKSSSSGSKLPLHLATSASASGSTSASEAEPDDPDADADAGEDPLLSSSASLATIMKARENAHDDGAAGYFLAVSLYGGARARVRSGREDFLKMPEGGLEGVEEALERASRGRSGAEAEARAGAGAGAGAGGDSAPAPRPRPAWWGHTRPLSELHDVFFAAQWGLDVRDEARLAARRGRGRRGAEAEQTPEAEQEQEQGQESGMEGHGEGSTEPEEMGMERGKVEPTPTPTPRSPSPTPGEEDDGEDEEEGQGQGQGEEDGEGEGEGGEEGEEGEDDSIETPPPLPPPSGPRFPFA